MLYISALLKWGGLAVVLSVGFAKPPHNVTDPVCVTQADTVRPHLEKLQWIVAHSSPAILSDLDLPSQPAGGVTVVADEAICSQALTAFNGQLVGSDTSLAATRVIVLQAGNRFVVTGYLAGRTRMALLVYLQQQLSILTRDGWRLSRPSMQRESGKVERYVAHGSLWVAAGMALEAKERQANEPDRAGHGLSGLRLRWA